MRLEDEPDFVPIHPKTHFHSCSALFPQIGCDIFVNEFSKRATTVSLSVLVVIEMFNVRLSSPVLFGWPLTDALFWLLGSQLPGGERQSFHFTSMEKFVPSWCYRIKYVVTFHDPLRSLLLRMYFHFFPSVRPPSYSILQTQTLFVITPLNWAEWKAVLLISFPVIVIDEAFKLVNNLFVVPSARIKAD